MHKLGQASVLLACVSSFLGLMYMHIYIYTPLLRQLHVVETHNRDITAIRSLYTHCGFLNPVISCPFMESVMCFMKLK